MSTSCSRRQSFHFLLTLALVYSLAAGNWPRPQRAAERVAAAPAEVPAQTNAETQRRAAEAFGKPGVRFEKNRGQAEERVRFLARHGGATVFLTDDEAVFVLSAHEALARRSQPPERCERPKSHAVRMKFEGANPWAEIVGERELEGRVNYVRGSDPSKWQTKVKTYGAVRYRGIYDGVDLVYYGNARGEMEYDFEVAAGANADQISLKIEGAKAVKVDASGDLVIDTPAGPMRQRRPTVYQEIDGARRAVEGRYAVEPNGRVRFALGAYDRGAPLVIDPVLVYSFFLEEAFGWPADQGVTTDSSGNFYMTGNTETINLDGSVNELFFVAKFTSGPGYYFTYFDGLFRDESCDIAADSSGHAYVAGYTTSNEFPVVNAFQSTFNGDYAHGDAFLFKLSADGSELVYSTYLGGSGIDRAIDVAVDSAGQAYVTGITTSDDFPVANALQGTHETGHDDTFVTKFNAAGSALVYSTYLNGSKYKVAAIAADPAGNAYLTGSTNATDFPVVNAFQGANAGSSDAFVAKLNAAGSAFIYSTYLGGSGADGASDIALDPAGRAYVTGGTSSTDFPTANAFQGANAGGRDVFVTRLKPDGTGLVFSTYLGGSGDDSSAGIGVDSWGHATVGGQTTSTDFPLKNPLPSQDYGDADAFVARLKANGSALLYSTYVGTENADTVGDVTADPSGNAYLIVGTLIPGLESFGESTDGTLVIKLNTTPVIKGRVVAQGAASPVGVPGVTVTLAGAQTASRLTDAQGYYSFTGLTQGGDYTVAASKANLSLIPASRSYTNLFADVPNANFTVPALSVSNPVVTEGNAGEVSATFEVRLRPASAQPVTVNYQTADGAINPATSGVDYTARPSTQLTFDPGQTAKTVTVKVKGDTLDEANETFRLVLSAPTNALISDSGGVCVIMDNDPRPALSVNNVSVTEGDADVTATFTVTLSAASALTVKVKYMTANGSATAPADYTAGLGTLTFAPGETIKTISVTVKGDTLDEPAETFKLLLASPTNATITTATGTCIITDDD